MERPRLSCRGLQKLCPSSLYMLWGTELKVLQEDVLDVPMPEVTYHERLVHPWQEVRLLRVYGMEEKIVKRRDAIA
jgi:hypothetical protein